MNILQTLELLKEWKKLPAYRAEPRVDFIVAGALPEIIKYKYGCNIKQIIPELPIRIGTIDQSNNIDKSYKVDFYINLEDGRHIFIEFKTDSGSRRTKQDKYLFDAKGVGMKAILDGIIKIYSVTTYKEKYSILIDKLIQAELITRNNSRYQTITKQDGIEILYLQPHAKEPNEIGFTEIAKIMSESEDLFYKKFSEILLSWAND